MRDEQRGDFSIILHLPFWTSKWKILFHCSLRWWPQNGKSWKITNSDWTCWVLWYLWGIKYRCTIIHCKYRYGSKVNIYQLLIFEELIQVTFLFSLPLFLSPSLPLCLCLGQAWINHFPKITHMSAIFPFLLILVLFRIFRHFSFRLKYSCIIISISKTYYTIFSPITFLFLYCIAPSGYEELLQVY